MNPSNGMNTLILLIKASLHSVNKKHGSYKVFLYFLIYIKGC